MQMDIFTRDRNGFPVSTKEPEFARIQEIQWETRKILAELNTVFHDDEEIRALLSRLTGRQVDQTVEMWTPFYTDFGRNIQFGKNVFVNANCTFMDRGGITIEDGTFIGPGVRLITLNHDRDPEKRHISYSKPIHIGKNVWLGAGVTILPGVTVGDGAIVAAGAVVTKDILPMTVTAGVPATLLELRDQKQETEAGMTDEKKEV